MNMLHFVTRRHMNDYTLLGRPRQAGDSNEEVASTRISVRQVTQCLQHRQAQRFVGDTAKIDLIIDCHRSDISAIKLKRTDTTLDLSHVGKERWRKKTEIMEGWEFK